MTTAYRHRYGSQEDVEKRAARIGAAVEYVGPSHRHTAAPSASIASIEEAAAAGEGRRKNRRMVAQ